MKAEARYMWQHEIVGGRKKEKERREWGGDGWRRVSLTFRVEKGG